MKTFALALLSASAEALMTTVYSATVAAAGKFTAESQTGEFVFGYDSTALYFQASMTFKMEAKAGTDTVGSEIADIYAFPLYGTSLNAVVVCTIKSLAAADATYQGEFNLWVNTAFAKATYASANISGMTGVSNVQRATAAISTNTNAGTAIAPASDQTAADTVTWTLLTTSSANFVTTNRVITCAPKVKYNGTLAQNAAAFTSINTDLMYVSSATDKIFLGYSSTATSDSTVTYVGIGQPVTTMPKVLGTAIGQVTSGTVSTGTATTSGGDITGTPALGVTAWTSTQYLYVDFDSAITSTTALAASAKYATMQCIKLGASEYMCVCSELLGDGSGTGIFTWSAYGSATAPASADFTANKLPTDSVTGSPAANLATVTKYYPLFMAQSVANVSNTTLGTANATRNTWKSDTDFQWSATGNYIGGATTEGKQYFSRLQYKRDGTNASGATTLKTALDGWVASTVGGCGDYVSSTEKAVYTWTADTTSSSSSTCTTTTTGALSLATIGAAIALAVAF